MSEILKKSEPRIEVLGDGNRYTFAPPSLSILVRYEEAIIAMGPTGSFSRNIMSKPFSAILKSLQIRLAPYHPELTEEAIGVLIDSEDLMELANDVASELTSKLVRKPAGKEMKDIEEQVAKQMLEG